VDSGDGRALSFGPRGILAFVALNTCHFAYLSMSRLESICLSCRFMIFYQSKEMKNNNNNNIP
jgi:hypothetical protein